MQTNQIVVLVSETHVRLIEFAFPIVLIIREGFTKKIAVLLDFVQIIPPPPPPPNLDNWFHSF